MKHAECERLVDRYMSGAMSVSEEQDFFIQVAVNDELRQTLKAYRVVENALRKDRSTTPAAGSDRSRVHIMAMLAATAPVAGGAAAGGGVAADMAAQSAAATSASTAAGGVATGGILLGTGTAKLVVAAIAAVALSLGTFVIGPIVNQRADTATDRPLDTVSAQAARPLSVPNTVPLLPVDSVFEPRLTQHEDVQQQIVEPRRTSPVSSPDRSNRGMDASTSMQVESVVSETPRQTLPQSAESVEDHSPRPIPSTVDSISFKVDVQIPEKR